MINAGMSKLRILVVDDEPEIRDVLCELLSDDYECMAAASAEEALELLRGTRFELVISDIMMSGMSGLEMVPHLHAHSPETVVVMISGVQTIERD
jgi:DNA-binding NtrC family response regulator